ncbi:universal stress protein [Asanoa sp. NPDC050611]|uniref:universal stress protein n=1 Tax=Asanoa sp. NPDC050611 TaxID=3157098 RepID=UPI0033D2EAD6
MTIVARDPVVVGVDGSESALRAARTAAREALLRHRRLLVTHAFTWALIPTNLGPNLASPREIGLRTAAEQLVADAVGAAEKAAPGVEVEGEVRDGAPATVLLHHAARAELIVLGDRGLGGFTGLVIGSVAVQVAAHAACPVLVVKGATDRPGPVVVGVDGSGTAERALAFAFAEAHLRGADLVAVLAWRRPEPIGVGGEIRPVIPDEREEGARLLEDAVAPWCARYPGVRVTRRVVPGRPAKVLVEESRRAQLTLVGARGRGGFAGLLLGSVSHTLLHHTHSPVVIVHK